MLKLEPLSLKATILSYKIGIIMQDVVVIFEPSGLRVLVKGGTTVLSAAHLAGLDIPNDCGGRGTCGKCKVSMHPAGDPLERDLEHLTNKEIENGIRLACRQKIIERTRILIPKREGQIQILTSSESREWIGDSGLDDQFGIAVDLGTTTVVVYLLDLSNGIQISQSQSLNPQSAFGEDVISRIKYASKEGGAEILQQRVVDSLNQQIAHLLDNSHIGLSQLSRMVVVGNTVMQHLLLKADTQPLGMKPYSPSITGSTIIDAKQIGLMPESTAELYLPPNIAGYVGGDTVGFILSQRLDQVDDVVLGIDIGTNGEIVLSNRGEMYCCSAAAGPAFEGATILHGMRGQEGAIEYLSIGNKDDRPQTVIIGGIDPRGICGSAIVDIVAELHRVGILDDSGQMKKNSKRIIEEEKIGRAYTIVNKKESAVGNQVLFTQKDVRQVQLAKAAIRTGCALLLEEAELDVSKIDRILLAGAFGNYIRPSNALAIGLLPRVDISQVVPVGNAAGEGAKGLLLSKKNREIAEIFVDDIMHVDLASHKKFQETFLKFIGIF